MQTSPWITRLQVGPWLLALCVLIACIGYPLSAGTIADPDALVMGEVARRVSDGARLYGEAWDNKPPITLLFFLPPQSLAPGSYLGQQIFCGLWTLLQGALAFLLLRAETAAVRYAATCLVLLLPMSRVDFIWASSEDSANLFVLVLTLIGYRILRRGDFLRWELWVVGLTAIVGFHSRQTVLFFAALPCLAIAFAQQPWKYKLKSGFSLLGGVLVGGLLLFVVLWACADLNGYVQALFVLPRRYGATNLGTIAWVIREQLSTARAQIYGVLLMLGVLVAPGTKERLFLAACILLSAMSVLAPSKPFGHYQEQLAPCLVLAAIYCISAFEAASPRLATSFALTLVLYFCGNAVVTADTLRKDGGVKAELNQIVDVLDRHANEPTARLLAMGANSPYVYFKSRMRPVHRFHWDLFFDANFLPVDCAQVVAEIEKNPPTWFVMNKHSLKAPHPSNLDIRAATLAKHLREMPGYEPFFSTANYSIMRLRDGASPTVNETPLSSGTP